MKHPDNIKDILSSLDTLEKARPSPILFDRIMQTVSFVPSNNSWVKYIKVGIAAMLLLTVGNVFSLYLLSKNEEPYPSEYTELLMLDFFETPEGFTEYYEQY